MKGEGLTLVNSSTTVITVASEPLVLAPAFAVSSPEREKPPRLVQQHSSESDEKLTELERKGGVAQVAESLRWVQKHPVLAAVIWVFGKVVPHDLGAASTARSESEPCISSGSAAADDTQTGSGEKKTSSRRLSWNDERGGTLAEYFEDPRPRFDVVESSEGELLLRMGNDDSAATRAPTIHDPEGVHLHNCSALYDDLAGPLDGGGCKGFLPNGALPSAGTWSPQWGWYVNMTPPQEMYPCPNPTVAHPGESHSRSAGGAAAIVPKYPRR